MQQFTFLTEPKGEAYQSLLRLAFRFASSGVVAVLIPNRLSEDGKRILDALAEDIRTRERRSSWPGTTLIGSDAEVVEFALTDHSFDVVNAGPPSLFAWTEPLWPRDLSFVRADGTPLLATIASEQDAFLRLTEAEQETARSEHKDLTAILILEEDETLSDGSTSRESADPN